MVQTTLEKAWFDNYCLLQKEPEQPTTPEIRPGSRGPGGQQSPTHYTGSWPDFVARFNMLSGAVYHLNSNTFNSYYLAMVHSILTWLVWSEI